MSVSGYHTNLNGHKQKQESKTMVTISIRVFVYFSFSQRARFRGGVHRAGLCHWLCVYM